MEWRSKMEIVDVFVEGKPAAATDGRPPRFPRTDDVAEEVPEVGAVLASGKRLTCT